MQRIVLAALACLVVCSLVWFVSRADSPATTAPARTAPLDPTAATASATTLEGVESNAAPDTRRAALPASPPSTSPTTDATFGPTPLVGHVVPKDGGAVTSGARVRVTWKRNAERGVDGGPGEAVVDVSDDGTFEALIPKAARRLELDLLADFLALEAPLSVPHPAPDAVVLSATRGGCLIVEFTGPNAERAQRAPLEIGTFLLTASSSQESGEYRRTAFRGVDGAARFGGLPGDGAWRISLRARDFVDVHTTAPAVASMTRRTVELPLRDGCAIAGRVVDPEGDPVPGARLTFRTWERPDQRTEIGRQVIGRADDKGAFSLAGVLPGPGFLWVQADGFLSRQDELGPLEASNDPLPIEFVLQRGVVLRGRVVHSSGEPAGGAQVSVTRTSRPSVALFETSTESDGTFVASGFEEGAGAFLVHASIEGDTEGAFLTATAETSGDAPVELVLGAGSTLTGTVTDDLGAGLAAFRVVAKPLDGPGESLTHSVRQGDGTYAIAGLTPGRWRISVQAAGHASPLPRRIDVTSGPAGADFTVLRFASAEGRLVDGSGAPVAEAAVSIDTERTTSDVEGRFQLKDLVPGDQRLMVAAAGLGSPRDLELYLAPGETRSDLTVTLPRGSRILGEIHADAFTGKERGVLLRKPAAFSGPSTTIDAKGRFEFTGLDEGQHFVRLDLSHDEDWAVSFAKSREIAVEVPRDGDAEVVLAAPDDYPITVSGTVRRGGAPTEGLLLYVYKPDEETRMPRQITRTDAEGRYEVRLRQTGPHSFCVGEGQAKNARFLVEVTNAPRQTHDFDMPGQRLTGWVVSTSGDPVSGLHLMLTHADVPSDVVMIGHTMFSSSMADGRFEFTGLHPGTYRLRSTNYLSGDPRYGLEIVEGVEVLADGPTEPVELIVPEGAIVDVRAVDGAGRGIAGCAVTLLNPNGRRGILMSSDRTDARGLLRHEGLGPGRWQVVVEDAAENVIGRGVVDVTEGSTTELTVTCERS